MMEIRLTRFDIIHCLVVSVVISFIVPFFTFRIGIPEDVLPGEVVKVPAFENIDSDTTLADAMEVHFRYGGKLKEIKGFKKVLYMFSSVEDLKLYFEAVFLIFIIAFTSCLMATVWNNSKKFHNRDY